MAFRFEFCSRLSPWLGDLARLQPFQPCVVALVLTSHRTSQLLPGHPFSFFREEVWGIQEEVSSLCSESRREGGVHRQTFYQSCVCSSLLTASPHSGQTALRSSEPLGDSQGLQAAAFSSMHLFFHLQEVFLHLSLGVLPVSTASPIFLPLLQVSSFL